MNTTDGYVQITRIEHLEEQMKRYPQIDTVKFSQTVKPDKLVYVALWSSTEHRGYGGCFLSLEDYETFWVRHNRTVWFIGPHHAG